MTVLHNKVEKRFSAEERRDRNGNPFCFSGNKKIVEHSPDICSQKLLSSPHQNPYTRLKKLPLPLIKEMIKPLTAVSFLIYL